MSEQEIELERVYTVPLSRAWITARHRRTRRAVHILREFAEHHMKSSEIKIDTELNEALWKRGITKPPRRITVKMEKDEDGVVTISLPKETKKPQEAPVQPPEEKEEKPASEKKVSESKTPVAPSVAPTPTAPATGNTSEDNSKEAAAPKKVAPKTPPKKKATPKKKDSTS